jgi:hypothetical protein
MVKNEITTRRSPAELSEGEPIPASVNVSVSMTLLNTSLVGVFNKSTVEDPITKDKTVKSEFLVMPTDEPKGGMTIMQVIEGINQLIRDFSDTPERVDPEAVKKSIDQVSTGGALDKIKVELRQIFIYRKVEEVYAPQSETPGQYDAVPKSTKKSFEYAINLVITSEITKSVVFNINSISFSIWNTARPKIIDRMQLGDINSLLKE